MNVSSSSKTLCAALFQIAKEKKLFDKMEEELRVVKKVVTIE